MIKEILIAESDKTVQRELERIFELTDYKIIISESEEALIRAKLFRPDLIIGGKEVYQAVKGDPEFKEIPFILLLNLFEDLTEKEKESLQVDGIISRPLNGDEVLNSIDRVMEIGRSLSKGEYITKEDKKWTPFREEEDKKIETNEEALSLGEMGEAEEEEIIELVDVVEEPEAKLSIADFAIPPKEEPFREIPPLEPWVKGGGKTPSLPTEERVGLIEKEEWIEREETEEKAPKEEFFEKIELEEILEKVERLEPLIEKEWPTPREEKEEKFVQPVPPLKQPESPLEEPPPEMELEELSEEEFPEAFLEELEGELERLEEGVEEIQEEIKAEKLEEEEILKGLEEEVKPELPPIIEEALPQPFLLEKELIPIEEERPIQKISPEAEIPSPLLSMEKRIEDIITKGVGEMMQDFMTKIIPGMTQHLLTQTLERIEKMIREIVPEIAEKAIQEEIKRLEKEEKE